MNWRYRCVLFFFIFLFLLIISRLFYWQVVRAQELAELGQQQYGTQVKVGAQRGEIKTSDGYSIAANKLTFLTFANPKEVSDKKKTADILGSILKEDPATISALLDLDKYWVPVKSKVESQTKEKIAGLKLPGIGFEDQNERFYPEASLAAKVLGFVGKDENGEDKGYFGLEGYYDRQLRGKDGLSSIIHDASGQPILAKMNGESGKIDGRTLNLHIDRTIQYILDRDLKDSIQQYGAQGGMAAVMDPQTGGILAMSSFPTFDPRHYQDFTTDLYKNPLITDSYEPGSTFKPLIMAAGLDAGLIKPDTSCPICAGPVSIGDYDIHTWNDEYSAGESMTDVLVHSDNTGMVYVGRELGLDRMLKYITNFGIGSLVNIDLQGEEAPELRPRDNWYPIDAATATFGQGITITPIELLTAFSAIANGGKRMEPHVVASVDTSDGQKIVIQPKVLSTPISSKTSKVMTEMMVNAVNNGEAKFARLKGYRIAGKTGTAQIPVAGHYDPTKTIASFVGFGPADNPRFLMLVIIDRPTSSIYGAETAAPVFFKVAKNILTYYGIAPTESVTDDQ